MASAKKTKKPAKKKSASAKQRHLAEMSPEELLKNLPEARSEHGREVRDLGNRIVDLIKESGYHPTVALDTIQIMLSTGIGAVLGKPHQQLWDSYVGKFHEESKMLSILEMLGGPDALKNLFREAEQQGTAEPTPEK